MEQIAQQPKQPDPKVQADQAKAAHHEGFTKGGLSQADALKPDSGKHRKRCGLITTVILAQLLRGKKQQ
jgi:hypothetical protein